jgi:hypothetical protein
MEIIAWVVVAFFVFVFVYGLVFAQPGPTREWISRHFKI